jgi:hypothetical protein
MSILNTLTGAELSAAIERCHDAINAEVERNVERIKRTMGLSETDARYNLREHTDSDGEPIAASWTGILYADVRDQQIVPVMIATEVREHNHSLLCIIDRSGDAPQYREYVFNTCDYVLVAAPDTGLGY